MIALQNYKKCFLFHRKSSFHSSNIQFFAIFSLPFHNFQIQKEIFSPETKNTSWGEGASLALVDHPSSDGVTIKMPYGVDILHRPASHPIFSYWVG